MVVITRNRNMIISSFMFIYILYLHLLLNYRSKDSSQSVKTDIPTAQEYIKIDPTGLEEDFKQLVEKCTYPEQKTYQEFSNFIYNTGGCPNARSFGGILIRKEWDGFKMVCMTTGVKPIEDNCTVVSVGINKDFSFDDDIDKYGCKDYALDPTNGLKTHKRGKHIFFHPIGLGTVNQMPVEGDKSKMNTLTYSTLLEFLGLENKLIDYLKIDIENSEIPVFNQILNEYPHVLRYVKQIGMEIHPGTFVTKRNSYNDIIQKLNCLGFKLFFTAANVLANRTMDDGQTVPCCYEVALFNTKFLTKGHK